jgi:hypothetical protein
MQNDDASAEKPREQAMYAELSSNSSRTGHNHILGRPTRSRPHRASLPEEQERDGADHTCDQREQQAGVLEAHVVEHLGDPERDRGAREGSHEGFRGHGAGDLARQIDVKA